jgi:hypothetical protein
LVCSENGEGSLDVPLVFLHGVVVNVTSFLGNLANIVFISSWKVAGALIKPNGMTKVPFGINLLHSAPRSPRSLCGARFDQLRGNELKLRPLPERRVRTGAHPNGP